MASNQGIQTLLEAEKEASKIVAKAKSYRVQRLKDARQEAQKEIEDLKKVKNQEFIEYEKKFAGDVGENVKTAEIETQKQIAQITKDFEANKEKVVDLLLKTIGDCKPQVHANIKKAA
ncbi:H(+)-transporting V1 sector ATPase subunit G [Boothiomyces macroporosus]|uniref:V-type proton ATPase subunit G n=1 Tax=Boothiomyces macroporosus TaxID=261099 RepID=A0AAD5Y1L9_9FUNG|nr:H(+)-transporting V1 sector ATPase subunit G [Boothiomyces macroporosus]